MKEYEYKWMLDRKAYEKLCRMICDIGFDDIEQDVHINYYYDTKEMKYRKNGTTVRVRQKDDKLTGEVKYLISCDGANVSREESYELKGFPLRIRLQGNLLELKGQLVTDRLKASLSRGLVLCLDRSMYLGVVDYEMELEYLPWCERMAVEWKNAFDSYLSRICALDDEIAASSKCTKAGASKAERFFCEKDALSRGAGSSGKPHAKS